MLEEFQDEQRRRTARIRGIMDITMGILFFLIGIYFFLYDKLKLNIFKRDPSPLDYVLGALFTLYGLWRIYRGYKKDYFR
jgi:hypothetical protein